MKRFLVIGLGNFGTTVALSLAENGHEVIAVDQDGVLVDRVGQVVARAVVGDATDIETLKRLGAEGSDAAVVSTGDDITASVLTSMALLDMKITKICVKVVSQQHARVMERLGVHQTIFPEHDTAIELAAQLTKSGLLNYDKLGADFGIQEMSVPDAWVGKTIRELNVRQKYSLTIVALHDCLTGETHPSPDPDHRLTDSETLFVAGSDNSLDHVAQIK
ncbi:potassium channel family protein [Aeoliella mucimassa]|uniref:Ktr system potassium uptake protein A n=1 Tax=Aeoliella mucimassa TaxID=2527972 RepID=A0A518ASQ3_9BACT|nr:TrkA family potassium uptake protein [Aeoliella mucimassa]QDU57763.1 Ktr system potassium uptake protein A [Aeoliella mucimassa]